MHISTIKRESVPVALRASLLWKGCMGMAAMLLVLSSSLSRADLLISPLRVVLDDKTQTATLTLRNTSKGARTYRLGWVEQTMDEMGIYRRLEEGQENPLSASGMIR